MSTSTNMLIIAITILPRMNMQIISMMIVPTVFYITISSSHNLLRIHGKVILGNLRET
ncbi:MAG: hypothetical protein ACI35Z_07885 [Sphingobacterium hotanense]